MKKLSSILILSLLTIVTFSQELHNPGEILKIMEGSMVSYEIDMLPAPILCPDRSNILNYNDVYRVMTDSSMLTYKYNLKPEAQSSFERAEAHFSNRSLDSARVYYEKVLEVDSSYYIVMTYLGQIEGTMRNLDQAVEWYNKVIANNYIDYMAHWFIADIYKIQGEIDKAVNEITLASILNRNNPRIKTSQSDIYKMAKIKVEDWCFVPQCEISKENDKVKVAFDEYWIGYAMPKALWKYEPGYRQSLSLIHI